MTDGPVREGEILAGKYRVERVLGQGGMGVVVSARHLALDERVALKFLAPNVIGNEEAEGRFAREARAAVKIKSEHVARVTDVGVLESGAPYIVMEFLDGVDLAAVLKQRGTLAVEDAIEYVLQACEAIAEAHSLGIVHRDLKPGNLFLARRHDGSPCVKVLDFGISKLTGSLVSSDVAMSTTQGMLGSPVYMAPEQMMSAKSVDERADVWALGVILYELLTGELPYTGSTLAELAVRLVNEKARSMRDHRPELPAALDRVVLACLEKDLSKRIRNVGDLTAALAEFGPKHARVSAERVSRMMLAAGKTRATLEVVPSSDAGVEAGSVAEGTNTAAAWGKTRSGKQGPKTGVMLGAAVAVIGILGVVWSQVGRDTTPSAAASAVEAIPSAVTAAAVPSPVPAPAPVIVPLPSVNLEEPPPAAAKPSATPEPAASTQPKRVPTARPKPTAKPAPKPVATTASPAAPPPALPKDFGGRN